MANNNEQKPDINSLKASFCRQHFPDLVRFLHNFDISNEGRNSIGNAEYLNMHFLLQAYEHKEKRKQQTEEQYKSEINNLKASCKWILNDVREDEVLLAIDEYIAISSQTHGLNKLLSKLFKVNINANTDNLISNASKSGPTLNYSFEDETTKSILEHFGIPVNDKKIGKQCEYFKYFISNSTGTPLKDNSESAKKNYYSHIREQREEFQFVNAFSLLSSLRNWSSHESMGFMDNPDQTRNFYRFIIFTHIGIVYICRRIWNKYSDILINTSSDYHKPKDFDNFTLKEEIIKINIAADERTWTIDNCKYSVDQVVHTIESNKNEVSFEISAKKYQQIEIQFNCNGKPYDVPIIFNYYLWNPVVDIFIKPPRDINYRFEGIAGGDEDIEKKIGEKFSHFAKLLEETKNKFEEENSKFLDILGHIEPSLQSLRDLVKSNNDVLRNNIKADVSGILNSSEKNILNKIDELNKGINQNQKQIDKSLRCLNDQIKSANINIIKNDKIGLSKNKKELLWYYPLGLGAVAVLIYVVLFQIMDICNIDYSASYVENNCSIVVISLLLLFILGLYLHWKYYSTKYAILSNFSTKVIGIIPFMAIIIIMLVAWGWFIPNKRIESLVANYDFAAKNHPDGDNAIAAKLMDNYLKEEDPDNEQARIKLANYYLKYTGEVGKALQVSEPMFKDVKKYPNGVWAYAEVLYEMKDFNGVWTILDDYNKDSSAIAEKLEGVMLSWGEGCTKDVHKGFNKLNSAYKKGNKDAMYQIGRFLVNDMTDWDTPGNSIDVADMDIIRGMYFLREFATQRPQAMIELGRLYEDLNMNDSAIFYYNRALHTAKDSLLVNETKYRLGLLAEKGIDSLKHYMTEAKLAKYPQAIIHSAIKEKDHKKLIAIYEKMGTYKGYRYISPIVFEYIATNQIDMALQTLRKEHPKAMFDESFVNGMAVLLGSDYIKRDSIAGEELIRKSAANGCKYAQMIVLFTQLQQIIEEGNEIAMSKIDELEMYGKRDSISFAYVLIANLMNRECFYDKAYHAAMKALSLGHPAGVIELKDDTGENPQWVQYKKSLDENRQKKLWFFRTKQIGLRNSLDSLKLRNITEGYFTDASLYNNVLSEWRLSFWSDVIIANPISGMAFFPLKAWMTGEKNTQRDLYKRRLLDSAICNHKGAFQEDERNLIVATLNNLADDNFRKSLIKKYGNNPEIKAILESKDDRGFNPRKANTYTIIDGILSLTHFDFESILTEISGVIGTDYFNNPFRK